MHSESAPTSSPVSQSAIDQMISAAKVILSTYGEGTPAAVLRRPTVKELRARGATQTSIESNSAFARLFRDAPEPKRQRKARAMLPRKQYQLAKVDSAKTLKSLTEMTPAATTIVMYLASHPGATVPEMVDSLDLKRKTVENLLSLLRQQGIVESVDRS